MAEPLFPRDIDWSRKTPCGDCPFLRTSPYHSGVAASIPEYADSIDAGNFAHTCHKTDNRPACDGPRNRVGQPQVCAGSVLMLLKTGKGKELQLPMLEAAERGEMDIHDMAKRARKAKNVFTLWQLVKFYAREVAKRARKEVL